MAAFVHRHALLEALAAYVSEFAGLVEALLLGVVVLITNSLSVRSPVRAA